MEANTNHNMHIHVFIKKNTSDPCDKQEITIKHLPVLEDYYIRVLFIYLFICLFHE